MTRRQLQKLRTFSQQTESSFCLAQANARSQRSGSIRAGGGNCLTEPGIVCFPVASHPERTRSFGSNDGKTVRGRRRSFGGPGPNRPGTRPPWLKSFPDLTSRISKMDSRLRGNDSDRYGKADAAKFESKNAASFCPAPMPSVPTRIEPEHGRPCVAVFLIWL